MRQVHGLIRSFNKNPVTGMILQENEVIHIYIYIYIYTCWLSTVCFVVTGCQRSGGGRHWVC